MMKTALVIVDIQNDFLPGGALAVPAGDAVIPVANMMMSYVDLVVASQDWHPVNHGSFITQQPGAKVGDVIDLNGLDQVVWPVHCVAGTRGAEFADDLDVTRIDHVVRKGTDTGIDSYSTFLDNGHRKATGLERYLKEQEVTHLVLVGLATDYCVKFSVLDAREMGFEVTVVVDGVRGVELQVGDCDKALQEMRFAGAETVDSKTFVSRRAVSS